MQIFAGRALARHVGFKPDLQRLSERWYPLRDKNIVWRSPRGSYVLDDQCSRRLNIDPGPVAVFLTSNCG